MQIQSASIHSAGASKVGDTPTPQDIINQCNQLCSELKKDTLAVQLAHREGKPVDPAIKTRLSEVQEVYDSLSKAVPSGNTDAQQAVNDLQTNLNDLSWVVNWPGDSENPIPCNFDTVVDPAQWKTVEASIKSQIAYCQQVMQKDPNSMQGIAAYEDVLKLQTFLGYMQKQDNAVIADPRLPYNAMLHIPQSGGNEIYFSDVVDALEQSYQHMHNQPSSHPQSKPQLAKAGKYI